MIMHTLISFVLYCTFVLTLKVWMIINSLSYINIYIYICIYVCVCVCVYIYYCP